MEPRVGYAKSTFGSLASKTAHWLGHPAGFVAAVAIIVLWGVTGPIFHFSDTWQLVINTGTTVITFLMVFLIQNTQNRESRAIQVKLDELIRALDGAHNALLDLEELSDDELLAIREKYCRLAQEAREGLQKGKKDTCAVEIEDSLRSVQRRRR